MALRPQVENNKKLFSRFTRKLSQNDPAEYAVYANRLAKWMSDGKAYYDEARPEILKMLIVAFLNFRRNASGADPFDVQKYLDHPMAEPYIQLVQAVKPFTHLFVDSPKELEFLLSTISFMDNIPSTSSAVYTQREEIAATPVSGETQQPILNQPPPSATLLATSASSQSVNAHMPFTIPNQHLSTANSADSYSSAPSYSSSHIPSISAVNLNAKDTSAEPPAAVKVKGKKKAKLDLSLMQLDVMAMLQKQGQSINTNPLPENSQPVKTEPAENHLDLNMKHGLNTGHPDQTSIVDVSPPKRAQVEEHHTPGHAAETLLREGGKQNTPKLSINPDVGLNTFIDLTLDDSDEETVAPRPPISPSSSSNITHQKSIPEMMSPLILQGKLAVEDENAAQQRESEDLSSFSQETAFNTEIAKSTSLSKKRPYLAPGIAGNQEESGSPVDGVPPSKHPANIVENYINKTLQIKDTGKETSNQSMDDEEHTLDILGEEMELMSELPTKDAQTDSSEPNEKFILAFNEQSDPSSASSNLKRPRADSPTAMQPPSNRQRVDLPFVEETEVENLLYEEEVKTTEREGPSEKVNLAAPVAAITKVNQPAEDHTDINSSPKILSRTKTLAVMPPSDVPSQAMHLVAIQTGLTTGGKIAIHFRLSQERFEDISKWVNQEESINTLKSSLCISIGCYPTAEIVERKESGRYQSQEELLTSLRSSWQDVDSLSMNVCFNGTRVDMQLPLPFSEQPNGLVDISSFLSVGKNIIELSHCGDLSMCTFVLYAHHPTREQLQTVERRYHEDTDWQEWLKRMKQPVIVPFRPFTH